MIIRNSKPVKGKQAVVFIHGQGEQVPMETLTEFVDSVWVTDPSVNGNNNSKTQFEFNDVWGKPDSRNNSHELRRITTRKAKNGFRTDFYSFYWADLMRGNTWQHFTGWLAGLLLRSPKRVPRNVFSVWIALWLISIGILSIIINQFFPLFEYLGVEKITWWPIAWLNNSEEPTRAFISWGASLGGLLLMRKLTLYFGDAARYTTPKPFNIQRRQEIRERGVTLMKNLMGVNGWDEEKLLVYFQEHGKFPEWDTDYDKIIIVSHSLGTIIGYDILRQTFADIAKFAMPTSVNDRETHAQPKKRIRLEKYLDSAASGKQEFNIDKFRKLQAECFEELRTLGHPWIISDFVTLGSPLTHAEFLMCYNEDDLRHQQEQRIFPTCPPMLEPDNSKDAGKFSYHALLDDETGNKITFNHLHHAAHFGFTRWNNLYSEAKFILFGDVISGPLGDHFNAAPRNSGTKTPLSGIRDIVVMPTSERKKNGVSTPFFTHNNYWKWRKKADWIVRKPKHPGKPPIHIHNLRQVLKLTEKSNL